VGGVGIQKRKNIIYIIYYAEGAREAVADAAATTVAAVERVSIFDKSKSHYHMYARVYTCATGRVENIYIHIIQGGREGVACRTMVFGQHNPSVLYIYIIILYCCCAACAGTGRRYNDNSYCCILYTPAGPIVQRVRRGSRRRRSVGRSARHTWTIVTRRLRRLRLRQRRQRHSHTCDTPPPPDSPEKRAGALVTMAHVGVDFTINYASPFSCRTHCTYIYTCVCVCV